MLKEFRRPIVLSFCATRLTLSWLRLPRYPEDDLREQQRLMGETAFAADV
jgi:hypothetical protein